MDKLFAAIEEKHPGFRILDFRASVNPNEPPPDMTPEELDEALAEAVRKAEYVEFPGDPDSCGE